MTSTQGSCSPAEPAKSQLDTANEKQEGGLVIEGTESFHIPYHVFSRQVKAVLLAVVSFAATLSGLSSNIFFPAVPNIADALHSSPSTINLAITTYLIAQGLAPSVWSPLADQFGRRTILILTLSVYVAANVVLALSPNTGVLLVFRAVQAAGSSSTISLGAGVIADFADAQDRGGYLGLFSGARQSSIALGPVLGGVLTQFLGWRSIFWFLVILSGWCLVLVILLLPETVRRVAGNGSTLSDRASHKALLQPFLSYTQPGYTESRFPDHAERIREESEAEQRTPPRFRLALFLQPFGMLIEKDVACALLFGAFTYTAWSMVTASTTELLQTAYNFTTLQVGLSFLANGLGCVAGSVLSGFSINETFRKERELWNHRRSKPAETPIPRPLPKDFPVERARLSDAPMYSVVMIIGFLIFGWSLTPPTIHQTVGTMPTAGHWITPLLALFMIGYSNTAILNSNNALVVDLFPGKSASASAVINLSRNLTAAVGVALVDLLSDATNPGWLGVIFAGLVVIGVVPLAIHTYRGMQWRGEREDRLRELEV